MSRLVSQFRRYSVLIGVLILGVVVYLVDFREAAALIGVLPISAIAIASLSYGVNVLLKAIRWHRMIQQLHIQVPLQLSISAFLSGALYGMLTIGRLGELLRVEALLDRTPSRARALSTCIADRVLDLAFLGVVALVGSARALGLTMGGIGLGLILAGMACMLLLGRWLRAPRTSSVLSGTPDTNAPTFAVKLGARLAERSPRLASFAGGSREVLIAISELLLTPRALETLAWTALSWVGYFGAVVSLAAGLGYDLPLFVVISATAIAAASAALPISFQGVGTREAAFALVLGPYGMTITQAATLSLTLLTLLYAVTVPLGLLGLLWRRRQANHGV